MITAFEGHSADDVWKLAASEFIAGNKWSLQGSRAGANREILHAAFSIQDPRQRWVVSREPPINPAFALAEVVWILNGSNDAEFLNYWNRQLPKYAGSGSTYHGAYGYRLKEQFAMDQLSRAFDALNNNSESRQVILLIWDPNADLPGEDGLPLSPDIPCNIVSILKVRDGKLFWTQVMRSNDLFRGTPYNFIQFTSLQEIMAGWLGIRLGGYDHFSDSLHIYKEFFDSSLYSQHAVQQSTDSLAFEKEESDRIFEALYKRIESMTESKLTQSALRDAVINSDLPASARNMLAVLAAETSRRRGWSKNIDEMISYNDNPLLRQAWDRWQSRFRNSISDPS